MSAHDLDALIIGSGAGGLTCALALARAGKKVMVLEQHEVPGGWCHSFVLDGHRFSPGVHYIGELQEGGRLRQVYEGLGIGGDLVFLELNPDGFDHVTIGDVRFDVPAGLDRYQARLRERFPAESSNIQPYFELMERLDLERHRLERTRTWLDWLAAPFTMPRLILDGVRPLSRVLDRFFDDPCAKTILAVAGCGDYGLPPSRAPAVVQAALTAHYRHGGFYPRGGAYTIPRAFCRGLRRAGATVRLRTPVASILTENARTGPRAIGVRLGDGEELRARWVISNADPGVTFLKLMDPGLLPSRFRERVRGTRWSTSCMSLFLAVDLDLAARGFDSGNHWWLEHPDLEQLVAGRTIDGDEVREIKGIFLTVTTLKDRAKGRGLHTLEVFAFCSQDAFARWESTPTGSRPPDYERLKQRIADRMLDAVEHLIPDIRPAIRHLSVGTPLTNAHYVPASRGCLYGTEKTWDQLGPFGYGHRTPVQDLYLCGASVGAHGVMGATLSGLGAARALLECGEQDLFMKDGAPLRVLPADRPDSWPESLRPQPVTVTAEEDGSWIDLSSSS